MLKSTKQISQKHEIITRDSKRDTSPLSPQYNLILISLSMFEMPFVFQLLHSGIRECIISICILTVCFIFTIVQLREWETREALMVNLTARP